MAKLFEFPGTSQTGGEEAANNVAVDLEHAAAEVRSVVESLFRGESECYVIFLPEKKQTEAGIQMRPLVMPMQSPRTAPLVHVAIGEAMAISLVSGSSVNIPLPFNSVRFLTTAIVSEMGYASGLHRQVLFTIGLVLFVFIMLINFTLNSVLKREEE